VVVVSVLQGINGPLSYVESHMIALRNVQVNLMRLAELCMHW